jgi:hypothetical protein
MRSSFRTPDGNGEASHAAIARTPEERVRAFVRRLISPAADKAGVFETGGAWEIEPHLEAAQDTVRPFLPANAAEPEIAATALWLIGQCLIFRMQASDARDGFQPIAFTPEDTSELVELVVALALRGLGA